MLRDLKAKVYKDMGAWYVLCDCGGHSYYLDWESAHKVAYDCAAFHRMIQKEFNNA